MALIQAAERLTANRTCSDYKKNIQENKQIQDLNPMPR